MLSRLSEDVTLDLVPHYLIWVPLVMLEAVLYYKIPLCNWLVTCAALVWLFHRAGTVLRTPVDELVRILGIEVPAGPEASLSEIRRDGFAIHWKLPDQRATVDKYIVQVNGIPIGDVAHQECAIAVSGLLPGRFYAVRVIAVNAANFQASSDVIRLKTAGTREDDVYRSEDELEQTLGRSINSMPVLQAFKPYQDAPSSILSAPVMARELSSTQQQVRRGNVARRGTTGAVDQNNCDPGAAEKRQATETVTQLSEKLESLRRAIAESQKQEVEDEEEQNLCNAALAEKKELLRQQLKDKDDESKDLKRIVQNLERQNTAVQNKRAAQERLLQQKVGEQQKMKDDMKQWKEDILALRESMNRKEIEAQEYSDEASKHVQSMRDFQNEVIQGTKSIEEDIRQKGIQIKELEDEKARLDSESSDPDILRRHLREAEEDRTWQENFKRLQATYQSLSQEVSYAEWANQQILHRLDSLRSQSNLLPAFPADNLAVGHESPQARYGHMSRNLAPLNSGAPPPTISNAETRSSTNSTHVREQSNTNNPFTGTSFPFHEQSTLTRPNEHGNLGVPQAQAEKLMNGATTSPSAGALLPSGLLADDAEDPPDYIPGDEALHRDGQSDIRSRSQRNSLVHLSHNAMQSSDILPGLGNLPGLGSNEGHASSGHIPTSPGSHMSRSPSLVSSPHESMTNIHHYQPRHPIVFMDSDRRSIRSTSSASRNQRATSKFADFLNFRQRGKTVSTDGPALGSLKTSQSQSMPRQTDHDQGGFESLENSRRKVGNTGGLLGHISNALSRKTGASNKEPDDGQTSTIDQDGTVVYEGLADEDNMWLRSALQSSRPRSPSSTYSIEHSVQPSVDGQLRGWSTETAPYRNNPLHAASLVNPWSANPSRRQSIQHDISDDLLHGIPDDDEDNDVESPSRPLGNRSPTQAPIGTKPRDAKGSLQVKQLNPNARTFEIMNMFKKREKTAVYVDEGMLSADDSSPPESRKSKDDRPRSATDSFEEYAEGHSDSGMTTPSETAPQPTSSGKESFIRKITRKGSSNMVNLPFFKDKTNRKGLEVESAPDETDEDGGTSAALVRSIEIVTSSPQVTPGNRSSVLSWSSFRKRTKKGNETPSIDEASLASETGDEEEFD